MPAQATAILIQNTLWLQWYRGLGKHELQGWHWYAVRAWTDAWHVQFRQSQDRQILQAMMMIP